MLFQNETKNRIFPHVRYPINFTARVYRTFSRYFPRTRMLEFYCFFFRRIKFLVLNLLLIIRQAHESRRFGVIWVVLAIIPVRHWSKVVPGHRPDDDFVQTVRRVRVKCTYILLYRCYIRKRVYRVRASGPEELLTRSVMTYMSKGVRCMHVVRVYHDPCVCIWCH